MYKNSIIPGTTLWAERKSQWLAMGIGEEDMIRPKIAVVNTSHGTGNSCYGHMDELSRIVQQAILDAGALPFEIRMKPLENSAVSERAKRKHPMLSRDLMAREIQSLVEGAFLEGMVCIASDDKDTPAHLIAAARLNIPAIVLPCGYQVGASCENESFNGQFFDICDAYDEIGLLAGGGVTKEEYAYLPQASVITTGTCAGLSPANSMQLTAEALGMSLPGSSPVWAKGRKLHEHARRAGELVVRLAYENVLPSDILTPQAFENAVMVLLAVGGSVSTVRHLAAIAAAAGLSTDIMALFERYGRDIALLTAIRPNGTFRTEDFDAAGGTAAVMNRLRGFLNLDAATVTRNNLAENIAGFKVHNDEVIHPLKAPLSKRPSIGILRGNLAPGGALIKLSALPENCDCFSGPAKVFMEEEAAIEAVHRGAVRKGDVLILRNMDPEGGQAEMLAFSLIAALHGADLAEHVAVITDGQLSGLNHGIVLGLVMPDAASGGPLALIQYDDPISIDFRSMRIQVNISNDEMDARFSAWRAAQKPSNCPRTPSLILKSCWCQPVLDENYLSSGHSIHGKLCMRRKMLTA